MRVLKKPMKPLLTASLMLGLTGCATAPLVSHKCPATAEYDAAFLQEAADELDASPKTTNIGKMLNDYDVLLVQCVVMGE